MWTKRDAMTKPGCLLNATDDEPVFVLRGRDIAMPEAIRYWASIVRARNGGNETQKTIEAAKFADEVVAWQRQNGCKIPD